MEEKELISISKEVITYSNFHSHWTAGWPDVLPQTPLSRSHFLFTSLSVWLPSFSTGHLLLLQASMSFYYLFPLLVDFSSSLLLILQVPDNNSSIVTSPWIWGLKFLKLPTAGENAVKELKMLQGKWASVVSESQKALIEENIKDRTLNPEIIKGTWHTGDR